MTKKNKINLAILIVLVVSIPVVLYLVSHPQFFKPKAGGSTIEVFGDNIVNLSNGQKGFTLNAQGQPIINLRLTSPFGPPGANNTNTNSTNNTTTNNSTTSSTAPTQSSPANSFSLSPSSGSQRVGGTFDVVLNLNAGSNIISFVDININSDSAAAKIASFTPSSSFNTVVANGPATDGSGAYHVVLANNSTTQLSGNINVGSIRFSAASAGQANVKVVAKEVTTAGSNPIDIQTGSATATFTAQ